MHRRIAVCLGTSFAVACSSPAPASDDAESALDDPMLGLPPCSALQALPGGVGVVHVSSDTSLQNCTIQAPAVEVASGATLHLKNVNATPVRSLVIQGRLEAAGALLGNRLDDVGGSPVTIQLRGSGNVLRDVAVGSRTQLSFTDSSENVLENVQVAWGPAKIEPTINGQPLGAVSFAPGESIVFKGGEHNIIRGLRNPRGKQNGTVLHVSGSAVEATGLQLETGNGTAVRLDGGGRLHVSSSAISWFDEGIATEASWLVLDAVRLEGHRGDAIAVLGDPGPIPPISCRQNVLLSCPSPASAGAGPMHDQPTCPVINDSFIVNNGGNGIRLNSMDRLQVSRTQFSGNKGLALLVNARWLHSETFLHENAIANNNGARTAGGTEAPIYKPQIRAPRLNGVLDLRHNGWGGQPPPTWGLGSDGEYVILSDHAEGEEHITEQYACPQQGYQGCACGTVCGHFDYSRAAYTPYL